MENYNEFSELKGKTIVKVDGLSTESEVITFYCSDGTAYKMFHNRDCCESVTIDDICGDVNDIIGSEILVAEDVSYENENPEGVEIPEYQDSFTWTFYKLATIKGYVDIRWYGSSNGYYSERVDFVQVEYEKVKIFASIIDEKTKKQVKELSESDAYKDCTIRVMPDCHAGKGCTIGSVIKFKERVVPNTVGVDIGCGMLVVELGDVDIDLEKLDRVVNEKIPSGFNVHEIPIFDFDFRLFANINDENIIKHIKRSIGTLGGGNHFIELDADDCDNKYLVIHSGSRNLGVQVCNFWQNKAIENMTDNKKIRNELIERLKSEGREKDIHKELKKIKKPNINKELAYLEGGDLHQYMHDMMFCQNYAIINRQLIAYIILKNMGIGAIGSFTTIHNYIDVQKRIIRKGAISAEFNEKVIIPMNMRDGSLICIGKGNKDWLVSAPHGAGRIMSRKKAFDSLKVKDFEESMNGIYSTSVCYETLDEAPMAYKPIDVIKNDINDTVNIIDVIKPLWNFKAKTKE